MEALSFGWLTPLALNYADNQGLGQVWLKSTELHINTMHMNQTSHLRQVRITVFVIVMLVALRMGGYRGDSVWWLYGLQVCSVSVNSGENLLKWRFLYHESNAASAIGRWHPSFLRTCVGTLAAAYAVDVLVKIVSTLYVKKTKLVQHVHLAYLWRCAPPT